MGEVQVPRDALWRAQTQRAVENFPISGTPLEPALIHAIGRVKAAAAKVNGELGVLDAEQADGDREAPRPRSSAGEHDDAVPDRRLPDRLGHQLEHERQRGASPPSPAAPASRCTPTTTSTPASPATTPSRPRSTSPPTLAVVDDLLPALDHLAASLEAKAEEFADVVKSGRTHLMDATPVMLGQEFGGYAATVRYAVERLEAVLPRVARAAPGRHGGRHRHQHPAGLRGAGDRRARRAAPACRSPRPATTSRPRAPATRSSS